MYDVGASWFDRDVASKGARIVRQLHILTKRTLIGHSVFFVMDVKLFKIHSHY